VHVNISHNNIFGWHTAIDSCFFSVYCIVYLRKTATARLEVQTAPYGVSLRLGTRSRQELQENAIIPREQLIAIGSCN